MANAIGHAIAVWGFASSIQDAKGDCIQADMLNGSLSTTRELLVGIAPASIHIHGQAPATSAFSLLAGAGSTYQDLGWGFSGSGMNVWKA